MTVNGPLEECGSNSLGCWANGANAGLLVACSVESGSTYASRILARYLGAQLADTILDYYSCREQNLHEWDLARLVGSRFVLPLHIKAYTPHLALIERHRLKVVHLWRNLGDSILSLDDHILNGHWETSAVYIDNLEGYRDLSKDARHRFLIEYGLPWYVSFHLGWRKVREPGWLVRCKYEHMVQDKSSFFVRIIESLGTKCDFGRLRYILETHDHDSRFEVGRVGRSIEGLSEANKLLLERKLIEHPQDLTELLHELPWRPGSGSRILVVQHSV